MILNQKKNLTRVKIPTVSRVESGNLVFKVIFYN